MTQGGDLGAKRGKKGTKPRRRRSRFWLFLTLSLLAALAVYWSDLRQSLCRWLDCCLGIQSLGMVCGDACLPEINRIKVRFGGSSSIRPIIFVVKEAVRDDINRDISRRFRGAEAGSGPAAPVFQFRQEELFEYKSIGSVGARSEFCLKGSGAFDLVAMSAPLNEAVLQECRNAGIGPIAELKFGYDAVVLVTEARNGTLNLTSRDLYLALAEQVPADLYATGSCEFVDNPYTTWSQVAGRAIRLDGRAWPIRMTGPGAKSGTRAIFVEKALRAGAMTVPCMRDLAGADPAGFHRRVSALRDEVRPGADNAWFPTESEDDLSFLERISGPAIGIVSSLSYNRQGRDFGLGTVAIDGVEPSQTAMREERYPLTRPLFLYVKERHARAFALNAQGAERRPELRGVDPLGWFLFSLFSVDALSMVPNRFNIVGDAQNPEGGADGMGLIPIRRDEVAQTRRRITAIRGGLGPEMLGQALVGQGWGE